MAENVQTVAAAIIIAWASARLLWLVLPARLTRNAYRRARARWWAWRFRRTLLREHARREHDGLGPYQRNMLCPLCVPWVSAYLRGEGPPDGREETP